MIERQFREIERQIEEIAARRQSAGVFLLTDTGVAPLVRNFMKGEPRVVVESGEGSKTVDGAVKIWGFLTESQALRNSLLVNVGGGMVSDLGGFAAATFKRGIGCINVPTTLLAAVDASIGGKTGINFKGIKNQVGAFSLPVGVFPLTSLFKYLPQSEWLSGVGEAIKTGLLESEELFSLTVSREFIVDRKPGIVEEVVERCAAFKQKIVEDDFRESGCRKILNLGHTAGHAIESWMFAKGKFIPHGIAVAHGISHALRKSVESAGLDPELLKRYDNILKRYFPPLEFSDSDWIEVQEFMAHDKKNLSRGTPSWVLLKGIGEPVF